ncbi:biotin--[acetyl-CoA-carboxylase] ligase [Bacteroidota bacterium]
MSDFRVTLHKKEMEGWQKIIKLNSVDSTNDHFANLIKESTFAEGSILSSLHQEAGKGHGSNTWESEKGKNVLLSMVLYPNFLPIDKNFLISKIVSLGIANYLLAKTNFVKIKWPNDIYYQNNKLAGILIENTIKGSNINQSIVGIGLNLNQIAFVSEAPNPLSLQQITGRTYSIDQEIIKLRNNIRFFYDKLRAGKYDEINKDYLKCLYRFNELHTFSSSNKNFKAKITGISEYGHLQVTTESQEPKEFDFKEIEFII